MIINPKIRYVQGNVTEQFRTGVEWQPARPNPRTNRKNDISQPDDQIKSKVEELLVDYFQKEQPPANDVAVIKGSLRLVDAMHDIWVASVQTTIHFSSSPAKYHTSRVRFKVLSVKQGRGVSFSIYHNHVIFI